MTGLEQALVAQTHCIVRGNALFCNVHLELKNSEGIAIISCKKLAKIKASSIEEITQQHIFSQDDVLTKKNPQIIEANLLLVKYF